MASNMLSLLKTEKTEIRLFYTSRFLSKTIELYGGVDRSRAALFSTCHYQVVKKNIELSFSCGKSEKTITFEPRNDRLGLARLLSPCYYLGTTSLDNSVEVCFKVSSLEPYIQARYDHDEIILSSPPAACPTDIKYTIHSKKYGTLISLYPENIFTIKETIASRAGLGRIALGRWETTKAQYLEITSNEIDTILFAVLFIYQVIFQIIRSDNCDVSS